MNRRIRVTPYGRCIDYLAPNGDLLYCKYIAYRIGVSPGPEDSGSWRSVTVVAAGLMVVQLVVLAAQLAMLTYVWTIADGLLVVA